MTKPNETTCDNEDKVLEDADAAAPTDGGVDEFQLTIKKLEMPVRPRGVLAD